MTSFYILMGLAALFLLWCLYIVVTRSWERYKRWRDERQEGDWGWGEYGVLMKQPDGTYRPMELNDLMAMEQETQAAIDDFWFQHELRAYQLYGAEVLKPQ